MKTMLASVALLCGFLLTAVAADKDIDSNGKPNGYKIGQTARYAVWYDGSNWQVRVTCAGKKQHKFTGTITTIDGKFVSIDPVGAEGATTGKKVKSAPDIGTANPARTEFRFTFSTTGGFEDGLRFVVGKPVTGIKFTLEVDGKEDSQYVYIGANGDHPEKATFTLPNPPKKSK